MRLTCCVLIVAGVWLTVLTGCDSAPKASSPQPVMARVSHIVLFKLKDPAQASALIADCDQMLGPIPGVAGMHAGRHLDTGRGPMVMSDYDVGLWIAFDSEASLRAYDTNPNHKALVEKWRPQLVSIRVYDILDE